MLGIPIRDETEAMMGVLSRERFTSEDCLTLNVWSPTLDGSAGLPVLVWLHGGGWSIGSASSPLYDFSNLAARYQVVTVGINHRLGILGFLDLSQLGEEFAQSGNVGMLDVVAALEWVKENIAAFGGDPANVTVFGESGGGAKTSTLLGMPGARGLFHQAYVMSGAMLRAQLPEQAEVNTQAVLDRLGLNGDAAGLETIEVETLIQADADLPSRTKNLLSRGGGFSPVLGPSLPDHPEQAIRSGLAEGVTVVAGCTTDEMLAFMFFDPDLWTLTLDAVRARIAPLLGDNTNPALTAYQAARPDDSPTSLLIAIATDFKFRLPHIRIAEAKIEGGGAPAHMYEFAWGHPDPTGRVRAPHGTDMPYFFDNLDKAPIAAGPHAEGLARAMSGSLAALATTGTPHHDLLPAWPPYSLSERPTMRFDVNPTVRRDPGRAERAFWDDTVLDGIGAH
jgi:para-nitrobenzyl esterase